MAGQSDAADDLIAELAKLMAQDAHDDRKPPPSTPGTMSPPTPSVRIPGDAPRPVASDTSADFLRSLAAATPERNQPAPVRETDTAPAADPFHFDFGFQRDSEPAAAPAIAVSPAPVPAAPAAAVPAEPIAEHDSIADLISANLASDAAQEPVPMAPEPIAPAATPGPAAIPGPALMATSVAAGAPSEHGETLGAARSDQDRFKVPPVFGLGSTAPATPAVQRPVAVDRPAGRQEPEATFPAVTPPTPAEAVAVDPIDEIESLIGRAMSVEFDVPVDPAATAASAPVVPATRPAPRPSASPALRSLATPTLPPNEPHGLSPADQTIFAAAQASGAKVDWVTPPEVADTAGSVEAAALPVAPRQRRGLRVSRALAGPLVALTLLLAAGFGLYWVLGLGSRDAGPAPLLTADTTQVKEAAPAVATDGASAPQSVVFSEMDGATPTTDEQLLSRDQTDVNEVTQAAATTENGLNDEGLANRKVRTVKVRPDGTIVSGDDGVAGSAMLPVDRPNVPAIAGAETTSALLANTSPVAATPAATPAPETATEPAAEPATETLTPVEPGSTVTAVDLAGNPIAGKTAVVPRVRPSDLRLPTPQASAELATATATVEDTATATATTALAIPGATEVAALGNTAPAYVQLASQRNEADARQSAQNMVTRYGPLFGGANLEVQRVDLGAKGIYYRVRVPANSLEQANMICTNVKAAGGDCFTM